MRHTDDLVKQLTDLGLESEAFCGRYSVNNGGSIDVDGSQLG